MEGEGGDRQTDSPMLFVNSKGTTAEKPQPNNKQTQ